MELSERRLLRLLRAFFPRHQRLLAASFTKRENRLVGTLKIRCNLDKKTFLSDFVAELEPSGAVRNLYVEGIKLQPVRQGRARRAA